MGARIESLDGRPPLTIDGGSLQAIVHEPQVPSAQVKSGVLLAGLHASGRTRVVELVPTRDHTERALEAFGVRVNRDGTGVEVTGGQRLRAQTLQVPGDNSGAAFWAALAGGTLVRRSYRRRGIEPFAHPVLEVFRRAGVRLDFSRDEEHAGEPSGTLRFSFADCEASVSDRTKCRWSSTRFQPSRRWQR
jgi:3-phosphoshikimate 1-carboxyvinyltransferase